MGEKLFFLLFRSSFFCLGDARSLSPRALSLALGIQNPPQAIKEEVRIDGRGLYDHRKLAFQVRSERTRRFSRALGCARCKRFDGDGGGVCGGRHNKWCVRWHPTPSV